MDKVTIKKRNETYIQIDADPSILMEMQDHFSFQVPGAKFHPKVRQRMWDGIIRLMDMRNNTLYAGLLDQVKTFCEERQYAIEVKPSSYYGIPGEIENIGFDEIKEFALSLNLHSKGVPIEVRDYQIDAVVQCLQHKRKLLLSPTSSGKSLILYIMIRYIQDFINPDYRFLLIVPTVGLVSQMKADFADYSSENGWNADKQIHMIKAGEDKNTDKNIVISTWQSIYKLQAKYFNEFDVMICDEAHKMQASSITGMFERAADVKYRIGCTGTIADAKCHAMVLQGLTGPLYQVTTTKKLMDENQVTPLKIKCLVLDYPEEIRKAFKKSEYKDELDFIVTLERRNKFITNLTIATSGTTLVLYNFVDKQGKPLYNMIKEKSVGRKVFFVSGATSPEDREKIRQVANNEECIIVASYGVFSTGINIPSIENIIFASPSKSKIRNLQSIGRGLRLKDGKAICTLFDVVDDLSIKTYHNHVLRHFSERIKQYTAEQFKFEIVKINFK